MSEYGIVCPSAIGHLNPMCALAEELQRRNHNVTLFGIADIKNQIKNSGLNFFLIGKEEYPIGAIEEKYNSLGKLHGNEGIKFTTQIILNYAKMLFKDIPPAIKSIGIDSLIVDQFYDAGATIAERLDLPYVTICNALLVNQEVSVPPYFTNWIYEESIWSKIRNCIGNWYLNQITNPIWQEIQAQRKEWKLPLYNNREQVYSKLAQISQLPKELDFPRKNLANCFHYVGPLQNSSGTESISFQNVSFPWEKLTDKPLIYASLGTVQNKLTEVFQCIDEAVSGIDAQLVISLGNPKNEPLDYNLSDRAIVVPFAPHQKLIDRASLVITHAGMNTTVGALSAGVPMVAIPITNEQPGIAARLARTGAGEILSLKSLKVSKLEASIRRVLNEKSYQENAIRLQKAIKRAGGVKRAADIIEQAVSTRKPVYA
ncbi:MAG: glycosyltransferase [Prochloraceae cyanobacterium]|nr:glycosyltransferase [Prochloraceae cyanobacterium]